MPLPSEMTVEQCGQMRDKILRLTSEVPRVQGARVERWWDWQSRGNFIKVVDDWDIVDITFRTQKNGFVHGYDVYSDLVFAWALLTHAMYKNVTPWKTTTWFVFFVASQVVWLGSAGTIAVYVLATRSPPCRQPMLEKFKKFAKTWFILAFNGALSEINELRWSLNTSLEIADANSLYTVSFIPYQSLSDIQGSPLFGVIPQVGVLFLEDLPLFVLNLLISFEVGFSFASIPALVLGAIAAMVKISDVICLFRLLSKDDDSLLAEYEAAIALE